MSFWRRKIVTTKKPHNCAFCGGEIPTKSKAEYNAGSHEDVFQTYYFCLRCREAIDEWEIDLSEGFNNGEFVDHANKHEKAKCPACGSWKATRNWDVNLMLCMFQCKTCENEWAADFSFKDKSGF